MTPRLKTLFAGLVLAVSLALPTVSTAQDVAPPTGEVLLTISGNIKTTNVDDTLQLDREALVALGGTSFETNTIWTDGLHEFEGVSLARLTDLLGVEGGTIRATALNDYTIEIPVSDGVEGGPIIAYKLDGNEMSIRDKGPLWVVYPYDSRSEYRSEVIYSRSIWQLDRLEIVE